MPALFARLSRIVPLLAVLAFIAAVVYVVMSFRYSSERAKATLIQVFTWLTGGLSVIFALVTIYALFEQNIPVIELFASFLGTTTPITEKMWLGRRLSTNRLRVALLKRSNVL